MIYVVAHDGGCEGHSLPYLAFEAADQARAWVGGQTECWSIAAVPVYPELPRGPWFNQEAVMAKGDEVKHNQNQDIAGRPFAEIEGLLESLPYGPEEVPIGAAAQAQGLCATAIHTNYLLAAVLLELREIKAAVLPQGRVG